MAQRTCREGILHKSNTPTFVAMIEYSTLLVSGRDSQRCLISRYVGTKLSGTQDGAPRFLVLGLRASFLCLRSSSANDVNIPADVPVQVIRGPQKFTLLPPHIL